MHSPKMAVLALFLMASSHLLMAQEDTVLDAQLQAIASAHHGQVTLFARNLKTGQTAALQPDQTVKTASVIKLGILLEAAEQLRAGKASLEEKLELTRANQVAGSGVLGILDAPMTLTLRDVLTLMVVVSDNTATNVAIDRLGLTQINATLRAVGLKDTYLYKKVYVPASESMPADQPQFGLGKTTAKETEALMERLATCQLALDSSPNPGANRATTLPTDGTICAALLHMLRNQQDRNSLPRYLETLDAGEQGSSIANKTGALDAVRNDVALIATKAGPIVVAAFTQSNADRRWTGDNEAEQTLGKLALAIVNRWSPHGLDAQAINWENPLNSADRPTAAAKP